jgi:hypothetical protein
MKADISTLHKPDILILRLPSTSVYMPGKFLPVKLVLGLAMAIGLVPCSTATRYLTAKSLSNNSSDSLAPSSDKHTDLAFVAGSEM